MVTSIFRTQTGACGRRAVRSDSDPDVCIFAADILGTSGRTGAVSALSESLLTDSEVNVDLQIALDTGEIEDNVLTVRFPSSAVLYLRHRASTPDVMTIRIELPGGKSGAHCPPQDRRRVTTDRKSVV